MTKGLDLHPEEPVGGADDAAIGPDDAIARLLEETEAARQQLENILESILPNQLFRKNVTVRENSGEAVEFAVLIPSKDMEGESILLPVDAKFPREDYERLQVAYDAGNTADIQAEAAKLVANIRRRAADISSKYIEPGVTTDFAILFLPFEGLYAEIARSSDLFV